MNIQGATIIATTTAVWLFIKKWIGRLSKIAEPLVKEAEERARDGLIDKTDRKVLVMKAISLLEAQGALKLTFFSRLAISWVVDRVAAKLPDFKISVGAKDVLSMAKKAI